MTTTSQPPPPRALVLTGFGINCDRETAHVFERAGAHAERVHLNMLVEAPERLDDYAILVVPGGFSFGDDVASGRILANRLRYRLGEPLRRFVDASKLVIGICNGFQVLVKMGILPLFDGEFRQETTLTHNDSGRFEDRWVRLEFAQDTRCIWVTGSTDGARDVPILEAPVRHGEGKFAVANDEVLARLKASGQIVYRYARPQGGAARGEFPANPNGSVDDIAGICDPTGRVFGLMPHPEAHSDPLHHPLWTRRARTDGSETPEEGPGLQIFRNAVAYARANLLG